MTCMSYSIKNSFDTAYLLTIRSPVTEDKLMLDFPTKNDIYQNTMADKLRQVQPMGNRTNRSIDGVSQNVEEKPFKQRAYQTKAEKCHKSPEKRTNSEVSANDSGIYNHSHIPDTDLSDDDSSEGAITITEIDLDEDNENDNLVSSNGNEEELGEIQNEAKFGNGSSSSVNNSAVMPIQMSIQTFNEKVTAWIHNNYRERSSGKSVPSGGNNFLPRSHYNSDIEDEDEDECNVLGDECSGDEVTIQGSLSSASDSDSSSSCCSIPSSHESESDSDDCCILLENEILDEFKEQSGDTVPVAQATDTEVEVVSSVPAAGDDARKIIVANGNAEDEIIFIKEQPCPRKVGSLLNLKWNRPVPMTVLNYKGRQMLLKTLAEKAKKDAALSSAREERKRKLSGANDTTSGPNLRSRCDIPPSENVSNDNGFPKEAPVYLRPAKLKRVSFNSTM